MGDVEGIGSVQALSARHGACAGMLFRRWSVRVRKLPGARCDVSEL